MYDAESVISSRKAYSILRYIYMKEEDGSYATEIANDLQMDRSMVSEIIGELVKINLLEKGKRTKAQYYEYDSSGVYPLLKDLIENDILEDVDEELLTSKFRLIEQKVPYDLDEAMDRDLDALIRIYFPKYLGSVEDSTIEEALDFFLDGAEMIDTTKLGNPDWLQAVKYIAKARHDFAQDPEFMLERATIEYSDYLDTIDKRNTYYLDAHSKDSLQLIESDIDLVCPECGSSNIMHHLDRESSFSCSECDAEFNSVEKKVNFLCPECGSLIEPEHRKESDCGCGKIINKASKDEEVLEFKQSGNQG